MKLHKTFCNAFAVMIRRQEGKTVSNSIGFNPYSMCKICCPKTVCERVPCCVLHFCVTSLLYHSGNEEYTCNAAIDTATALKHLVSAVRGVAATSPDPETRLALIDAAKDVLDKSGRLLEEASRALAEPQNADNQTRLAQVVTFILCVLI